MDLSQWEWTRACCGLRKRGVPDQAFDAPIRHHWAEHGEPEFTVLGKTDDDCAMEIAGDQVSFIRCVLEVPILGTDQRLGFGVWSTLSEQNYQHYSDSFIDNDQSKLGPMFGSLANRLPAYPDTLNLKLDVLPQDNRQRPLLVLWEEAWEHPLYRDQSFGIDTARLTDLLSQMKPCDGSA